MPSIFEELSLDSELFIFPAFYWQNKQRQIWYCALLDFDYPITVIKNNILPNQSLESLIKQM